MVWTREGALEASGIHVDLVTAGTPHQFIIIPRGGQKTRTN